MSATPPLSPRASAESSEIRTIRVSPSGLRAPNPSAASTASVAKKGCFAVVKDFVLTVSLHYTPTPKCLNPAKNVLYPDCFITMGCAEDFRNYSKQKGTSLRGRLQTAGLLAVAQREALREIPHFAALTCARLFSDCRMGAGERIIDSRINLLLSFRTLWDASRAQVTNIFCKKMSEGLQVR